MLGSVEHWVDLEPSSDDFGTGSELFNGEWLFGRYMMAAMRAGQMAIEQPNQREQSLTLTCTQLRSKEKLMVSRKHR